MLISSIWCVVLTYHRTSLWKQINPINQRVKRNEMRSLSYAFPSRVIFMHRYVSYRGQIANLWNSYLIIILISITLLTYIGLKNDYLSNSFKNSWVYLLVLMCAINLCHSIKLKNNVSKKFLQKIRHHKSTNILKYNSNTKRGTKLYFGQNHRQMKSTIHYPGLC